MADFNFNAPQFYDFLHGTPLQKKTVISKKNNSLTLTRPSPFSLQTEDRAELKGLRQPLIGKENQYVPLSHQLQKWAAETPPRFKRVPIATENLKPQKTFVEPFKLSTTNSKRLPLADVDVQSCVQPQRKKMKRSETAVCEMGFIQRQAMYQNRRHTLKPSVEAFQFKANSVPCGSPFKLDLPHRKIDASPFSLETDRRGNSHQHAEYLQSTLLQQQNQDAREFRANPWKPPMYKAPKHIPKSLTRPQPYQICSTDRAAKRQAFEDKLKEKEAIRQHLQDEKDCLQKEVDRKTLKEYRRNLFIKARPNPFPLSKRRRS